MVEWVVGVVVFFAVIALFFILGKTSSLSAKSKEAISYLILFFAFAFIAASRDPVLITIALLFLIMKVLTTGGKPSSKFEDQVRGKLFTQYP